MKTRTLIFITIFLLTVIFLFADDVKKEISKEEIFKTMSGTWEVVSKYFLYKKIIWYPDGRTEDYLTEESIPRKGRFSITESWLDSNGIIWFKAVYIKESGGRFNELGKISDSGNTWELIWSFGEYKGEWDENHVNYRKFIRRQ